MDPEWKWGREDAYDRQPTCLKVVQFFFIAQALNKFILLNLYI